MSKENISIGDVTKAHFIGIGGAGMSGLAKVLCQKGVNVSGSDIKTSTNTENLEKLGVQVVIGHKKENIDGSDVIVISSAIPPQNAELKEAKKQKKIILQRAQMLALIAQDKKVIAISGTHGKTTTTSMVSLCLENNSMDPTFLIGGELNDIGSNAKHGQSELFVAETDESDGSLLNFDPDLLVITNVEADHLDYFKSFDKIFDLFRTFTQKIKPGGKAIVYKDHPNIKSLMSFIEKDVITYGSCSDNDFYYEDYKQEGFGSSFKVFIRGKYIGNINLRVPGEHNVLNSLAAIAVGFEVGLNFEKIKKALEKFSGVKRRFQYVGNNEDVHIYDDYAHHPTEVKATLKAAAAEKNGHRLVCVFQPHRYSRTSFLANEFGASFNNADLVVITDVYASGESPMPGVSGKLIADAIIESEEHKNIAYMPKLTDVLLFLEKETKPGDIVITMGAGDISSVAHRLIG